MKDSEATSSAGQKLTFDARFVVPLALGATLNPVNSTMIATALVPIEHDLQVSAAQAGWLIASLYLASAVAQPSMGRFADLFGARRVYLAALVLVCLAGIIGEQATTLTTLVIARVILGIGTSAAYPSAMRLFRERAERIGAPPPRAAMGILSLAALSSAAIGPLLGGLLTQFFGWRAIFTVNIPLAIITAFFVLRWIPKSDRGPAKFRAVLRELDPVGMALLTATLLAGMFALLKPANDWWWALPVSLASGALLIIHSLRHASPFIDIRMLYRNRPLMITYMRAGALMMIVYCIIYGFSQWLESSAGYSPAEAGLIMLPLTIVAAISSLIGARTKGIRIPFIVSIASALVGSLCLLLLHGESPVWAIAIASLFFGLPQGMFSTSTQAAVYVQSPASSVGMAAGLQRTAQYIGAIAATVVLSLLYNPHATDAGFHGVAVVMGTLSALLLVATIFDKTIPRGRIG